MSIQDLESGKVRVLSKDAGDKRTPKYCAVSNRIIARGAGGAIVGYGADGKLVPLVDIPNCADIATVPKSESILFTRLTTGNPQRQQIWKASSPFPTQNSSRVTAVPKGSLRQVAPHPTEEFYLASHLWRFGEERVIVLKGEQDKGLIFEFEPLTPEMKTAAYPAWLQDGQWVCAYRVSKKNYDLYRGDIKGGPFKPLLESEEFSEFGSSYSFNTGILYFERLDREGIWSLASLDLETQEVVPLELPTESKEPFFAELPDSWFP